MPDLPATPTLADFQSYVSEMERERGFASQTVKDKCLLLGEEIGELFKAIRKAEGLAMDPQSQVGEIGDELADVFIYLCALANRFDLNLEQAFLDKETKNKQRKWQ
ncbi:MazG nucleotide pyrophosphohydrolase domain-containing protein [Parendozoicomonas haliclonae]|uniref:MazG nucleotide pyrophosphohydrolase domain protein n=1 Tax=Parendozoicomonas haliclonae TaxID=1960125 RepID=A0A1X7AJ30_9GAMM|nr:MazG nucleotide pyrophosphohydrolase domain-containing protein [Parendozoicomonas haliclonae]SMA46057.1 MazG nucleotide pyrophosphohydrolase domain protein [Parendozoicomonas haliclonae]